MLFVNGKKAFVMYDYDEDGNKFEDPATREFVVSNGYYYLTADMSNFDIPRNRFKDLASFIETDNIMKSDRTYNQIGNIDDTEDVYKLDVVDAIIERLGDLNEHTKVVFNDINAKECIIFQFNDDDLDDIIQRYMPNTNVFYLPHRNYEKRNLLVFVDGYRITDYTLMSDGSLVLKNIPNTIEIYVFKQYDYLYVDENKYNNNSYNFITKNIKRSIFF